MKRKRGHRHSFECIVVRKGQPHCKVQLKRAQRAAMTRKLKKERPDGLVVAQSTSAPSVSHTPGRSARNV